MYCTPEKDRAVFFAYKIEHYMNQVLPRFRMADWMRTRIIVFVN